MSFDEQLDGDIHGQCAADVAAFVKWWKRRIPKVPYMSKREIAERAFCAGQSARQDQLDACRPYLKEGETVAGCIARNRMDIDRLMGFLAAEKTARENLQSDAARYRWTRMNRLWLQANLAAMTHAGDFDAEIDKARAAQDV